MTLTVAFEFINYFAFEMNRNYVFLNSVQHRSSGENHLQFHHDVAALHRLYYLYISNLDESLPIQARWIDAEDSLGP